MSVFAVTFLMVGMMMALLAVGLPVAFVLGSTSIVFGYLFWSPVTIDMVVLKASDTMRATVLIAIPLFIFMACALQRSGLAESIYETMHKWMGGLKGGLAAGTIVACTIIAAMSGLSSTGVLMMGIIGYPSMTTRGYDKHLVMGAIMAGGALGMLIPPSLLMIVYALVAGESVGKMFLGGVVPGLMLSALFIAYILLRCRANPSLGPPIPVEERALMREKLVALRGIIIPLLLVVGVLGSIFGGIATPTEAAAVGAFGALISAAVHRRLSWKVLTDAADRTFRTVAMVMWIILGATVFASIYQGLGATQVIHSALADAAVSKWVILILMQVTWIILGTLMDSVSILLITAPVFIPLAELLGFDLLWFGILFMINVEMAALTPPFGFNLFVMRGIVPPGEVTMGAVYRSAIPFIILHFLVLVVVMLFPELAVWLPNQVYQY